MEAINIAGEVLELFERLPNIKPQSVEGAKEIFASWEREAAASLKELDSGVDKNHRELGQRQAEALSRLASQDALEELVEIGLLPEVVARRAAETVAAQVGGRSGERSRAWVCLEQGAIRREVDTDLQGGHRTVKLW